MSPHLDHLCQRAPALEICRADIQVVFAMMRETLRAGGRLLLCGNGGSAADAEHWAGELLKGFKSRRPIAGELRHRLGDDLANQLQGALPAIPLTGFSAFSSAFGNDCQHSYSYAQLVLGLGKPGDLLVGISTSGNASNVCHATLTARALGLKTVGLTGGSGGKLAAIADHSIIVPALEVYLIQELHLPVYHCLSLMLEDAFFPS